MGKEKAMMWFNRYPALQYLEKWRFVYTIRERGRKTGKESLRTVHGTTIKGKTLRVDLIGDIDENKIVHLSGEMKQPLLEYVKDSGFQTLEDWATAAELSRDPAAKALYYVEIQE